MRFPYITRILFTGLVLIGASVFAQGATTPCDFSGANADWVIGNGAITDDSGNKYAHLVVPEGGKDIARLYVKSPITTSGRALRVTFRHRNNVEKSKLHNGAWVFVQYLDEAGKPIKFEHQGWVLPETKAWCPFEGRAVAPAGTASVNVQIRIQNRPSGRYLDVDDVCVQTMRAEGVKAFDPFKNPELKVVASFSLQPDKTLKSKSGKILKNLSSTSSPCYKLPAQFCDNPDFSYGINASFTKGWLQCEDSFNAIFSLGTVFSGQKANSLEVAFINKKVLIARSRCRDNQYRLENKFSSSDPGAITKVAAMISRNKLYSSIGGEWKTAVMAGTFVWPADRPFYLGSTGGHANRFGAEISKFTLVVYKNKN